MKTGTRTEPRASRASAVRAVVPGLVVCALVAAVAAGGAALLPEPIGAVPVAIVLGLAVGTVVQHERFQPGIALAAKRALQVGVVLLGARLSLGDVATLGAAAVGLVVLTIVVGGTTATIIGRWLGLGRELRTLVGVGSAICGNTAIMAAAPALRAKARDVGLAVAAITTWGTVAVLLYPVIGRALGLDDTTFGIWAGLAVQDTSQVVATGAGFSDAARDTAIVVKLVRNTALAVVLPLIAWWWSRGAASPSHRPGLRKALPGFVLGFLALAALRSAEVIGAGLGERLGDAAAWFILLAVAGLGLSVPMRDLTGADLRPIAVGGITAAVLAAVALGAAVIVGGTL